MKSSFAYDLKKEGQLANFLDGQYQKHLKYYSFTRVTNLKEQLKGVDLILTHKKSNERFLVDEKAQLDYIDEDLPTFAFELSYTKNGITKEGWLFDPLKKTDFYALITGIYFDGGSECSFCKITLVNRKKLLLHLKNMGIDQAYLLQQANSNLHGKTTLPLLDSKKEGYLYYSLRNKAEKPLNLILKLEWLIKIGVAKRLV